MMAAAGPSGFVDFRWLLIEQPSDCRCQPEGILPYRHDLVAVERRCAALAEREQFVRATGSRRWPDGTVSACYRFRHLLCQQVLYEHVPPAQRVQWHRHLAERWELAYGSRAAEIAGELAFHFERGQDYRRALRYAQQAAAHASQRSAPVEANRFLARARQLHELLQQLRPFAAEDAVSTEIIDVGLFTVDETRNATIPGRLAPWSPPPSICRW